MVKKEVNDKRDSSFFEKVKTDKKYSAKVQLIGYGIFVVAIIIYVNLTSLGSAMPINSVINNDSDNKVLNNKEISDNLLEEIDDNYNYDIVVEIKKKGEEGSKIHYKGKSYENKLEINKEDSLGNNLYYKVDNLYYSSVNNNIEFIDEEVIYSLIDKEYVELNNILKLIDKASLDHVTDYSNGKKEYIYNLKVKDIIVSYKLEDVVEIEIEEENCILKIEINYSNLIKVVDDSIEECEVEVVVSDIGKVEEFFVENTSIE